MRLQSVLGISWMAVCGVSGIEHLLVLLFHASFFADVFYYSVAWFFCLLYLAGALAGFFLLRSARCARMLVGWISTIIVLATIVLLSAGSTLSGVDCVIGVLAAASLVATYVSAILKLETRGQRTSREK